MRILLAVDDSPHARAATEYVRKVTWPKGSRVTVLTVAHVPMPAYTEVFTGAAAPIVERVSTEENERCRELVMRTERELRDTGITTDARVLQGDPREAIVSAAEAEKADLVVMGSHGYTGFTRLLLGSVASHVVMHAPCSVTVVKLPKVEAARK